MADYEKFKRMYVENDVNWAELEARILKHLYNRQLKAMANPLWKIKKPPAEEPEAEVSPDFGPVCP